MTTQQAANFPTGKKPKQSQLPLTNISTTFKRKLNSINQNLQSALNNILQDEQDLTIMHPQ